MIRKMARDFISLSKNNKTFRKIVLLYGLTGIIIFFLFGTFTVLGVSRSATQQMNATELKSLEQSCNTGDLILRDIHSLASNAFSEDAAIREAMTTPYSTAVSQKVQSAFSDIMASSSLIDSIYVINSKYNIVYSSETSVKKAADFFDADIITYMASTPPKIDIYFARAVDLNFNPADTYHMDYISSVYRNSADCALVINIDQEKFQELVNLASGSDFYKTIVIDSDGVIISQSNKEHFAENMSDNSFTAPIFDKITTSGNASGSFRYKGAMINYVRSDILGFIYSSVSLGRNPLGSFATLLIYIWCCLHCCCSLCTLYAVWLYRSTPIRCLTT